MAPRTERCSLEASRSGGVAWRVSASQGRGGGLWGLQRTHEAGVTHEQAEEGSAQARGERASRGWRRRLEVGGLAEALDGQRQRVTIVCAD